MVPENPIMQVREGMTVQTADGNTLGKIARVWFGTDPSAQDSRCDEEVCSRLEVQPGLLRRRRPLFVPISAIVDVAASSVRLTIAAAAVNDQAWDRQPQWIAAAVRGSVGRSSGADDALGTLGQGVGGGF